jgi:diaminohydroxyphosphoribosylaminopyrimidine deaminase / 5-amino-6-(5-phosphoribosylamino)uracil reductase
VHRDDDAALMRRALELAQGGLGGAWPNPMVGALVVRDGVVIGEGFHARHGGPHAEVAALAAAGDAREATLYVTLEPCSHHGRTPPCTGAILEAGISRVVYAAADPNPRAAGGAELLRQAGVSVTGGVEEAAALRLNAAFFHAHRQPAPWVALKLALSLDGAIAAAPGTRTAITGSEALAHAHRLRASHDAVLVGGGTAAVDDPLLTVREFETARQPVRVVLSARGRLAAESRLVRSAGEGPVILLCGDGAPPAHLDDLSHRGVSILQLPLNDGGLDLAAALAALAEYGIRSALVEGGARLGTALLRADLLHRLYLYYAPLLLGPGALPAFAAPAALPPGRWACWRTERLGSDALITLDPLEKS